MNDQLKDILNFSFEKRIFSSQANSVLTQQTIDKFIKNSEKMVSIVERLEADEGKTPSEYDIKQIVQKISQDKTLNSRELKTAIMYFNLICEDSNISYKFGNLAEKEWRDRFFKSFLFCLLNNWFKVWHKESLKSFAEKILKKLLYYSGNNEIVKSLHDNIIFFSEKGPEKLASYLHKNDIPISGACQILGIKEKYSKGEYFSAILREYYKNNLAIDTIENDLALNDIPETKVIVIAEQLFYSQENNYTKNKARLKSLALRYIGMPNNNSAWLISNTNGEIRDHVRSAKQILKRWLINEYIDVVFETLFSGDTKSRERKKYWLKLSQKGYIDDIWVIGSEQALMKLRSNRNLASTIDSFFKKTQKEKTRSTCSIAMLIKDRIFVEFSTVGSLYVYQYDADYCDEMILKITTQEPLNTIDEIKQPYMQSLIESSYGSYYFNGYGRMIHSVDSNGDSTWIRKLNLWFSHILNIEV